LLFHICGAQPEFERGSGNPPKRIDLKIIEDAHAALEREGARRQRILEGLLDYRG
jgi:hypothetical protein